MGDVYFRVVPVGGEGGREWEEREGGGGRAGKGGGGRAGKREEGQAMWWEEGAPSISLLT